MQRDTVVPHERVQITFGESRTKQAFKEDVDINRIMRTYTKTGELPIDKRADFTYGDFSNVENYMDSLDRIRSAQSDFQQLPVDVRRRFDHDPAQLLDFLGNPENLAEGRELGLFKPAEIPVTPEPDMGGTAPDPDPISEGNEPAV